MHKGYIMKKLSIWALVLIAITALAWTEVRDLIVQPNADSATLVNVYDKDGNSLFNINSVDNTVNIPSGTTLTGTLASPTITAPTITGFITGNAFNRGSDVFTTTAAADTVLVSGLLATDYVLITGTKIAGAVDQQDVLQTEAKADTLIVHRLASGKSAQTYDYLIVR